MHRLTRPPADLPAYRVPFRCSFWTLIAAAYAIALAALAYALLFAIN